MSCLTSSCSKPGTGFGFRKRRGMLACPRFAQLVNEFLRHDTKLLDSTLSVLPSERGFLSIRWSVAHAPRRRQLKGKVTIMWRSLAFLLLLTPVFADEPHPTLAVGSAAPAFSLPGIDGKTHKLSDYGAAKVLVLVFTCNHCPTAQLYETRIKKLADDYRGKDVQLIAIQPNNPDAIRLDELGYTDVSDSLDEMKIRAAYRHFNFPYLYDGDKQTTAR